MSIVNQHNVNVITLLVTFMTYDFITKLFRLVFVKVKCI